MPVWPYNGIKPTLAEASQFVAPGAQVIGDVTLGRGSSVWYNCVLRGDVEPLVVGEDTNIQDAAILHGTSGIQGARIGDRVTVGHAAIVHACTIGDEVLIGMGAKVLDGAVVPARVLIAAGAIVTPRSQLESGYLYTGSPARPKRPLSDMEQAMIDLTWRKYAELAQEHRASIAAVEAG